MIKKIKFIKNMAVFEDFDWNKSVLDSSSKVVEFQKVNILYGRNYSGKTTASRVIRALETGILSDKYPDPSFVVEIEGDTNVTQSTLKSHHQTIRVFNEDFVRDNLRFIANSEESIKSFAILGDDNNKLELEIEEKERELGSEDADDGLLGDLKKKRSEFSSAESAVRNAQLSLDGKLTDKANKSGTGIKHNKLYGDATYNAPKLKTDIEKVANEGYQPIAEEEVEKHKQLLKEEPKPVIPEPALLNLQFEQLSKKTKDLVEKKITVSEPIQELLDDTLLQGWVRSGREYHEGKRKTCGFCGNPLSSDLWGRLDKHFNQESEDLRTAIESLTTQVKKEINQVDSVMVFNITAFYSSFSKEIVRLKNEFDATAKMYVKSLSQLNSILNTRLDDVFTPAVFYSIEDVSSKLEKILTEYDSFRTQSNNYTNSLSKNQQAAITALRLHEVHAFISDIKYSDELAKIAGLKTTESEAKNAQNDAQLKVTKLKGEIEGLKAQLKDESKGADRVNHYLNNFFGHESVSLKAAEGVTGYRFEVTRNGEKAHHLSEGECSLVAFCYFMAKLEDVETKGNNPIIWIDDPISSLDANHIFFVFSLIGSEIVKNGKFKQLFISTHNLDFLKYLKRLPVRDPLGKSFERKYFVIERASSGSEIRLMPGYLREYVTEFNYLFHQIYKCANADISTTESNYDCFYNYGNNARKFLEAFLYYKYPNANKDDKDKLVRFFGGDALSSALTERLSNEYSHLLGVFERSISPIDVPEMKKTAQFILHKIKEKDPDQYNALLESIGEVAGSAPLA